MTFQCRRQFSGDLFYVRVLRILRGILEILHVFLMVLHHCIHIVLVKLLSRNALQFGLELLRVIRNAFRDRDVLLLRELLKLAERHRVVLYHHLGKLLDVRSFVFAATILPRVTSARLPLIASWRKLWSELLFAVLEAELSRAELSVLAGWAELLSRVAAFSLPLQPRLIKASARRKMRLCFIESLSYGVTEKLID